MYLIYKPGILNLLGLGAFSSLPIVPSGIVNSNGFLTKELFLLLPLFFDFTKASKAPSESDKVAADSNASVYTVELSHFICGSDSYSESIVDFT